MTVHVTTQPPIVDRMPPFFSAKCDQCGAFLNFQWHHAVEMWRTKHERECKGGVA